MIDPSREISRIHRRLTALDLPRPLRPVGLGTRSGPTPREVEPLPLASLDSIEDLDREEMVVTALAATPVDRVAQAAAEVGLILCPLVPIGTRGTLGGLYASGEESPAAPVEGHLRDAVLGVEGFTGAGDPLRSGGRVVKNVTGYDLTRFLSGSRGTLAVITRLHWRLRRAPDVWTEITRTCEARSIGERLRALRTIPDPTAVRVDLAEGSVRIRALLEGGRAASVARAEQVAGALGDGARSSELATEQLSAWLDLGEDPRVRHSTREWIALLEEGAKGGLRATAFPFVGPGTSSKPAPSATRTPQLLVRRIRHAWDPHGVLWDGDLWDGNLEDGPLGDAERAGGGLP